MNMQTKTALISGASRGLGLALAQRLAQAGWQLIINARGQQALTQAHQELEQWTTVTAISGDISQKAHRQALAVAARAAGGLDLLINNAGILGPSPQPALLNYPLDMLETVFRVNVVAQLGMLQAVADTLKPDARIINITSDAAVEPYAGWGGYGASKAAFEHLSAIFAAELADQLPNIRVYWVDPGDMRTQMHQEAFPGEDISDRPLPEASLPGFMALINGKLPNGRYQAQNFPVEVAA
ncbi:SDR family NAD(P)-dependent oxidoreductase [Candidatus Leptofilum sp.]|uniref:SDR family NAD(P)-dependent oxidoreductase n=1 Tax=Candidatus Leptofilum sp. TaxID=3241576 RepID=UPI003B5B1651